MVAALEQHDPVHLGDAEAYRRDRRKDRLLQEHGYLVLRYLAEDVVRDLDTILDSILRSLARRRANPMESVMWNGGWSCMGLRETETRYGSVEGVPLHRRTQET